MIDSINRRYFEGHDVLFPAVAEGFDQFLALVENTVGIYNEVLADRIERVEILLIEAGDGQDKSPLTIDLATLVERVQGAAKEQASYLVGMANADALDLLGESRQALESVDRHL